jgi:hypothetical protein
MRPLLPGLHHLPVYHVDNAESQRRENTYNRLDTTDCFQSNAAAVESWLTFDPSFSAFLELCGKASWDMTRLRNASARLSGTNA